jgi:hypothetical protein
MNIFFIKMNRLNPACVGQVRLKKSIISLQRAEYLRYTEPGFAMNKMSLASGNCSLCNLKNSLNKRFTRFLFTAPPTFLLTVIPNLRIDSLLPGKIMIKKFCVLYRIPCLVISRNSDLLVIRSFFFNLKAPIK